MREERKRNVSFKLTEEQRKIRGIISLRAHRLRVKTKKALSEEGQRLQAEREQAEEKLIRENPKNLNDQERKDRQRIKWRRDYKRRLRMEREATDEKYRQKTMAQEEERRIRAEREQAEEKLMRIQREQHLPRAKRLTDQQRKDRSRIRARNRYRRLHMDREATDDKNDQKRMAQKNSAGKETVNAEIDNPVIEAPPMVVLKVMHSLRGVLAAVARVLPL